MAIVSQEEAAASICTTTRWLADRSREGLCPRIAFKTPHSRVWIYDVDNLKAWARDENAYLASCIVVDCRCLRGGA